MPTYEYHCQECGEDFELRATVQQKIAGLQPECPRCHSRQAVQQFRAVNVVHAGRTGNQMPMPMGGCCAPGRPGGC